MQVLAGTVRGVVTYRLIPNEVRSPTAFTGEFVIEPVDEIVFPATISLTPPDSVSVARDQFQLEDGEPVSIPCEISEFASNDGETISLWYEQTEHSVRVPPPSVLYAVAKVLEGESDSALEAITENYGADKTREAALVSFRRECQESLSPEIYARTIGSIVDISDRFNYLEYRGRYDYFVSLLHSASLWQIDSIESLSSSVDNYNETVNLKDVSVAGVLAQYLAENRVPEAREHLLSIGCKPKQRDSAYETPFPAAWLANLYITDGFRSAEFFARDRPRASGLYARNKTLAESADHGNRREKWGAIIADAARDSLEEFRYVLYKLLYHTAREIPVDAAFHPMLQNAAKKLAIELDRPDYQQSAAFEEQNTLGHINRHDGNHEAAMGAFEKAHEIATGEAGNNFPPDQFLEFIALSGKASSESDFLRSRGELDHSIVVLEEAIDDLRSMHIQSESLREGKISHLYGKLFENRGGRARADGECSQAREAFNRSIKEYDRAGNVRSKMRVEEKLGSIDEEAD